MFYAFFQCCLIAWDKLPDKIRSQSKRNRELKYGQQSRVFWNHKKILGKELKGKVYVFFPSILPMYSSLAQKGSEFIAEKSQGLRNFTSTTGVVQWKRSLTCPQREWIRVYSAQKVFLLSDRCALKHRCDVRIHWTYLILANRIPLREGTIFV